MVSVVSHGQVASLFLRSCYPWISRAQASTVYLANTAVGIVAPLQFDCKIGGLVGDRSMLAIARVSVYWLNNG